MTLKAAEFDRIVEKFGLRTRDAGDRLAWPEVEGRIVLRTKRSHRRGDLPFSDAIRQQLKLTDVLMRNAINCRLGREGYLSILRDKGLL